MQLWDEEFVVMPNHIRGIIWIVNHVGATHRVAPTEPRGSAPESLGGMVAQFKSVVTKRINQYRSTFALSVLQGNYYEHMIRNEESLKRIRQYIGNNPLQWALGRENRDVVGAKGRSLLPLDLPWHI